MRTNGVLIHLKMEIQDIDISTHLIFCIFHNGVFTFFPLGGSADGVLAQIAAQRKKAAGLIDVKTQPPEKRHSQTLSPPPSATAGMPAPDSSLPDTSSHPNLLTSDISSRRVRILFYLCSELVKV